jgi:hypothetical protein
MKILYISSMIQEFGRPEDKDRKEALRDGIKKKRMQV